jgi:hypothetical protein
MTPFAQFLRAAAIIASVMIGLVALWAARFLPGSLGRIFAWIFHVLTTPIILEISFAALGVVIVLAIAHRAEKNADEWVEMDFPDDEKR